MNSETAFNPATAERSVIDRAEFARLIRKCRALKVYVSTGYWTRDKVESGTRSAFIAPIPAKRAIEQLEDGDFDAFIWQYDDYGAFIDTAVVSSQIQLRRLREQLVRKIREIETDLQRLSGNPAISPGIVPSLTQRLEVRRTELAGADARLAALRSQPVAA